tara:strand:- start:9342 stop:9848 length:507 start_codon:yes stop_codon:yes gene_type:complete
MHNSSSVSKQIKEIQSQDTSMFRTFVFDIDGTIFKHKSNDDLDQVCVKLIKAKDKLPKHLQDFMRSPPEYLQEEILDGVKEFWLNYLHSNDTIILTSARLERHRLQTEIMLNFWGLRFDHLILGIPSGVRYLFNDIDPKKPGLEKAVAINLKRNEGLTPRSYDVRYDD